MVIHSFVHPFTHSFIHQRLNELLLCGRHRCWGRGTKVTHKNQILALRELTG